jgi:hypothetical protein
MTDFIDRLERQLVNAAAAPVGSPRLVTSRARRVRLPVVVLGSLLATATIALAATGLLTGSPVQPARPLNPAAGEGIPLPGESRLLSLRVADPDGGLPWGMRIVHTTRGLVCLQIGRVDDGQLGELGIDGAFHDDGRFHPLSANVLPPDAVSGSGPNSSCELAGQSFTRSLDGLDRNAAPTSGETTAGGRDQRAISYGLLGAHALRINYTAGHSNRSAPVMPGTGAYLLVQRITQPQRGETTSGSLGLDRRNAQRPDPVGALTAITYRFGAQTCSDSLDPMLTDPCPRPSNRVQLEPAKLPDLHQPLQVRLDISHQLIYGARLRFTAPYAVTSAREDYEVAMPTSGACHGGGGGTVVSSLERNVIRGSTLRIDLPYVFANSCGRSQRLEVIFGRSPRFAPGGPRAILIGTIIIHEPPGTRPAPPPVRPRHSP